MQIENKFFHMHSSNLIYLKKSPFSAVIKTINLTMRLLQIKFVCDRSGNFGKIYFVFNLWVKLADLLNHFVTNCLFYFFIVISPLFNLRRWGFKICFGFIEPKLTCLSCHLSNHFQFAKVTIAHVVLFSLPKCTTFNIHLQNSNCV